MRTNKSVFSFPGEGGLRSGGSLEKPEYLFIIHNHLLVVLNCWREIIIKLPPLTRGGGICNEQISVY